MVTEARVTQQYVEVLTAPGDADEPVPPQPTNFPSALLQIGFDANPTDSVDSITWTDVSTDMRSGNFFRGRQHELQAFEAGVGSFQLDDRERKYDPTNVFVYNQECAQYNESGTQYEEPPGTYSAKVRPGRPIRLSAVFQGTTHHLFTGITESWQTDWTHDFDTVMNITAADRFKLLNLFVPNEKTTPYAYEVLKDSPALYWRLGETGNTARDSSTNERDGTYRGSFEKNQQATLRHDPDGAVNVNPRARIIGGDYFNFNSTDPFTVEMVLDPDTEAPYGICGRWVGTSTSNFRGWQVACDNEAFQQVALRLSNTWGSDSLHVRSERVIRRTPRHVAITYDGSKSPTGVSFSFDGLDAGTEVITDTLTGNITTTGTFEVNNRVVTITESDNQRPLTNYVLDELAVYESVLASTRIAFHNETRKRPWGNLRTDERVNKLMDLAGYSTSDFTLEKGVVTLGPLKAELTDVLEGVNEAARSEVGAFYVAGNGKFNFDHRYQTIIANSSVAVTYTDDHSSTEGHSYSDLVPSLDDANIWTEVKTDKNDMTRTASTNLVDAFGKRVLEWSGNWASDPMADAATGQLLSKFQNAQTRFISIKFPPNPDFWADILPRELNQERIKVERQEMTGGGAPMCREVVIEGIAHTIETSPEKRWDVDWVLSDASTAIGDSFTLDTDTLNSTKVLVR